MGKLRFKKHCEFCGAEFTAQKSSTRFCSHMCASRAYKAKKRQLVEDQVSEKFSMEEENRRKINLDNVYVMTPREAAAYLGLGKTTIYRYLSNGQIKALRLQSKTLIRKADLDSLFVTETRISTDSPVKRGRKEVKFNLDDFYDVKAVMELFGMSYSGVSDLLKKAGVKERLICGRRIYPKAAVDKIYAQRQEDPHPEITEWYSTAEIVEKFGMTPSAVYSMAYDYVVPKKIVQRRTYYSRLHVDAIKGGFYLDMLQQASGQYITIEEIREKYGMNRDQVDTFLKGHNIRKVKVGKIVKILKEDFEREFCVQN